MWKNINYQRKYKYKTNNKKKTTTFRWNKKGCLNGLKVFFSYLLIFRLQVFYLRGYALKVWESNAEFQEQMGTAMVKHGKLLENMPGISSESLILGKYLTVLTRLCRQLIWPSTISIFIDIETDTTFPLGGKTYLPL